MARTIAHDISPSTGETQKSENANRQVARSWYAGATDRHPLSGETNPACTGMNVDERYSWFKAPRYDGSAMEVRPLARVLGGSFTRSIHASPAVCMSSTGTGTGRLM